jgi:hypothetical protein
MILRKTKQSYLYKKRHKNSLHKNGFTNLKTEELISILLKDKLQRIQSKLNFNNIKEEFNKQKSTNRMNCKILITWKIRIEYKALHLYQNLLCQRSYKMIQNKKLMMNSIQCSKDFRKTSIEKKVNPNYS